VIFHIACSGCGAVISVDERYFGKAGTCLKCGKRMVIEPPRSDAPGHRAPLESQPLANVIIHGGRTQPQCNSGDDSVAEHSSPALMMPAVQPARDRLEQFARDLGIPFDVNATDRELSALIASALATGREPSPLETVNPSEKQGGKTLTITWHKRALPLDPVQNAMELALSESMSLDDVRFVLAAVVSQFLAQEDLTFPEYARIAREHAALPVAKALSPTPVAPPVSAAPVTESAFQASGIDDGETVEPSSLHGVRNYAGGKPGRVPWRLSPIVLAVLLLVAIAANVVIVYFTEFAASPGAMAKQAVVKEEATVPTPTGGKDRSRPAAPGPAVDSPKLAAILAARKATLAPAAANSASRPAVVGAAKVAAPTRPKVDAPAGGPSTPVPSSVAQAKLAAKGPDARPEKPPVGRNEKAGSPDAPPEKRPVGRNDKAGGQDVPKEKPPTGADEKTAGSGLDGRAQRRQDAARYGATSASEAAVEMALKWLAVHQMPDGGWCFDHQLSPYCRGQCRNPGRLIPCRIAATALGVLPFLGAGQTYQDGRYKQTIRNGLLFLTRQMQVERAGGSLCDRIGGMYGHGLASIALCEAYGMTAGRNAPGLQISDSSDAASGGKKKKQPRQTPDEVVLSNLRQAAQLSLVFISSAEDPVGGGWRYQPRMIGDTSVLGWQVMALCSGRMAYLTVDPRCFDGARHFLDTVAFQSGANYGYKGPERFTAATQAIGLLCRMYLGWKHDHPALQQGLQTLTAAGPSSGNMYYNYYATQVLHHYGGQLWSDWNTHMRDMLVATQAKAGHETGSWFFIGDDKGAVPGGRLYFTALAAMTLEVYYRHLPLYGENAFQQDAKP
jgi:hypothetical protein